MKNLIFAVLFAVFSATAFAQEPSATKKYHSTDDKLHCYYMKDMTMHECWGDKSVTMTKDAILKNGTTVTTSGQITTNEGQKFFLKNGECIVAENGKIGPMAKMHPQNPSPKSTY